MKDMHAISLKVNGRDHALVVEARRTLADMLRHDLGYTGTHLGCEHGICGACTVILDDAPVRALKQELVPLQQSRDCSEGQLSQAR